MMTEDMLTIIRVAEEKIKADGCSDCDFESCEEWQMPCVQCKRNCKDYWRSMYHSEKRGDNNG